MTVGPDLEGKSSPRLEAQVGYESQSFPRCRLWSVVQPLPNSALDLVLGNDIWFPTVGKIDMSQSSELVNMMCHRAKRNSGCRWN